MSGRERSHSIIRMIADVTFARLGVLWENVEVSTLQAQWHKEASSSSLWWRQVNGVELVCGEGELGMGSRETVNGFDGVEGIKVGLLSSWV